MAFQANSPADDSAMLAALGLAGMDELFATIPPELQTHAFHLPAGLSEMEMTRRLAELADANARNLVNFCGGGFYDHFIPAAVDALSGRAEFYTAYTPYQPEVAQGTLQAIYEFQTAMTRLTEMEMTRRLAGLADANARNLVNFCGGGFYDHFIPAAVEALCGRAEFYTAYTPYQPEVSQGTLQAIYEYQTAMTRLTEMEVANASLYDGGTALFEAIMMAFRVTRRRRVLIDEGVNPIYRTMLKCYSANLAFEFVEIPLRDGLTDRAAFQAHLNRDVAAVIVQNPNFFGCLDDLSDLIAAAHRSGALGIVSVYPLALGIVKTPGAMGADIVTGEGQSLGLPLSFGGAYLGFMTTRKLYVHKMPGRLVGATQDAQGRRGFVLTLQAREQHIRREKATSNICTAEALCALRALIT